MSLKTTISQKQKLSLTRHMKQSLELLQMDSIALKEKIEIELESNPMLDEALEKEGISVIEETLDIYWDDSKDEEFFLYDSEMENDNKEPFSYVTNSEELLSDFLLSQLETANISKELLPVVRYLILNLDDNGWLNESLEILSKESGIEITILQEAMKVIQTLEPSGVGASGYRECLLLQAKHLNLSPIVFQILQSDKCLKYMSNHQVSRIAKVLEINIEEADEAVKQILQLNPKPGTGFGSSDTQFVIPDVYVNKEDTGFSVVVGNPAIPEIKISAEYSQILDETMDVEVMEYLSHCLKQAQSLIEGISQRNKTLFLCVSEIIRQQKKYFESSCGCLVPMTLGDVADAINMSISTVSRAVRNKYIVCCHGIIPLNLLFTSKVRRNDSNKEISAQEIQLLIQKFVSEEDKNKPLSDPDISRRLSEAGYAIARRTVAKYRMKMEIPPASQRKR